MVEEAIDEDGDDVSSLMDELDDTGVNFEDFLAEIPDRRGRSDWVKILIAEEKAALQELEAELAEQKGYTFLKPIPFEEKKMYQNVQKKKAVQDKYRLHEKDVGSCQVQIAVLTTRIEYMTEHMKKNKKDYSSLRGLTRMVTRRRKLLEYLLKHDRPEFDRMTSDFGIRTGNFLKQKLQGARGRPERQDGYTKVGKKR